MGKKTEKTKNIYKRCVDLYTDEIFNWFWW